MLAFTVQISIGSNVIATLSSTEQQLSLFEQFKMKRESYKQLSKWIKTVISLFIKKPFKKKGC